MVNLPTIKQERANVVQNIANVEAHIAKLNQELQQANTNLIASRGAVMAFDRIIELESQKDPAPEQEAPHIVQ
jgi:phage shock protein A